MISEKERLYNTMQNGITNVLNLRKMKFSHNIIDRYRLCFLRQIYSGQKFKNINTEISGYRSNLNFKILPESPIYSKFSNSTLKKSV